MSFLEASGQNQVPMSEIYDGLKDGEHVYKIGSAM